MMVKLLSGCRPATIDGRSEMIGVIRRHPTESSRLYEQFEAKAAFDLGRAKWQSIGAIYTDARACPRMAVDMNGVWRHRGFNEPFRARMGINPGYCNVGNFGSDDRVDYTIIGAEV